MRDPITDREGFRNFHVLVDAASEKLDDALEAMRNRSKVTAVGPVMDFSNWVADFSPALARRRAITQLERIKSE